MSMHTQSDIRKGTVNRGRTRTEGRNSKNWKYCIQSSPPVLRAAESISLHFTRTESEVLGARGKEGMKEFDGALPSSFLLLELLLELLKKSKNKKETNLILNVFCFLQITLFEGKTQIFCYNHLMILIKKNTRHHLKAIYSSRVNTILKVSSEFLPGYSTQQRQEAFLIYIRYIR